MCDESHSPNNYLFIHQIPKIAKSTMFLAIISKDIALHVCIIRYDTGP